MTDTMDLDALFKEARAALRGQKAEIIKKREKSKIDPLDAPPDTQGIYRNPANWVRGKGIALIHRTTQTLLGNFTEYTHKTVKDARRLVREEHPAPVQSVEYIDLDLATSNGQPPTPKRAWQTVLSLTTELRILAFQAHAAHVPLSAHFGDGQLLRLELAEPTIFLAGDSLLRLPAGTDVLPELAPAAVTSILAQLNQPL